MADADTPSTRPAKRRRTSTAPTPTPAPVVIDLLEEGEVSPASGADGPEEGEVTVASERAAIDTHVGASLARSRGSATVAQKDARYYCVGAVVCEACGVKGHMSFDCPETPDLPRCVICATPGCNSARCPRMRAPHADRLLQGHQRFPRRPPSGAVSVSCYVCDGADHLDCAIGTADRTGALSCYNCGQQGHTGHGCNLSNAEATLAVARGRLDEDRRGKTVRGGRGSFNGGRGGRGVGKKSSARDKDEFHQALVAAAKARRYHGRR